MSKVRLTIDGEEYLLRYGDGVTGPDTHERADLERLWSDIASPAEPDAPLAVAKAAARELGASIVAVEKDPDADPFSEDVVY